MPGAFLKAMQRGGTTETRRRLLRECELLEVWEMPEGTVGLSARQETCVIIARKANRERRRFTPTLFNVTYSASYEAIRAQRDHLRSTWTFMATGLPAQPPVSWSEDTTARIIASPIDHVWRKIELGRPVSAICDHTKGILTHLSRTNFSSQPGGGFVPYLRSQGRLHPYFLNRDDWQTDPDAGHDYVDPRTAERSRLGRQSLMQGPKLIVTGDTNRNSRLQLKVAFDDAGVFPEHHFCCFALHMDPQNHSPWARQLLLGVEQRTLLLWLSGVMNSPIGHSWVATCSTPRSSAIDVFMSLPVPANFDAIIPQMVEQTASFARVR